MMKIIMQDPWGIRGLGIYDYSLCDALYKKNKDLTLITNRYYEYGELSNFKVDKYFFKYSEKLKVGLFRKVIRGLEYCINMLNLLKVYSKESPDIIHIQWLLFYQFDYFWLRILKYRLHQKNTKIILTAHNVLPHINGYKYKNILGKIYSQFDGIIVHSEVLKEQMIGIFGTKSKSWSICVTSIGVEDDLLAKVDQNISALSHGQIDFLYGYPYALVFLNAIPRSFWHTKPIISLVTLFTEAIWGTPGTIDAAGRLMSAQTLTVPGDFYWQFSIPGVIVGMWLWGLRAQVFTSYRKRQERKDNPYFYIFYIWFCLQSFNSLRDSLFSFSTGLILFWFAWIFVNIFCGKRPRMSKSVHCEVTELK